MHREQKYNMQHTEQNIQENTETEHTIQNTQNKDTHNPTQPQRTENSTYDLHKYNFDIYHEYVCINNSNTIELYTILQDKV